MEDGPAAPPEDPATLEATSPVAIAHPGDVLVFTLPPGASMEEAKAISDRIQASLRGTGVKGLVVGGGLQLAGVAAANEGHSGEEVLEAVKESIVTGALRLVKPS